MWKVDLPIFIVSVSGRFEFDFHNGAKDLFWSSDLGDEKIPNNYNES